MRCSPLKEGLRYRGRRCIEPEAVFGQIKYNMTYDRFRHFGIDKVNMDFAFFAIAFNIKKMVAKMTKEGLFSYLSVFLPHITLNILFLGLLKLKFSKNKNSLYIHTGTHNEFLVCYFLSFDTPSAILRRLRRSLLSNGRLPLNDKHLY